MITKEYTVWCDQVFDPPELYQTYPYVDPVEVTRCAAWEHVDARNKSAARTAARRAGWQELPDGTHRCPEHRTDR